MKSNSLNIRAFNSGGGFELKLPSGKGIVIDPAIYYRQDDNSYSTTSPGGFSREDITAADYIILTHSHWDHDLDIAYLVEKFNSMVLCGVMCAEEIAKYHKVPYDNIVPLYPNSSYRMADFTLQTYQAKHNPMAGRRFSEPETIAYKAGIKDHSRCDQIGNLESLDLLITTNNNFSMLMASGSILWEDIFDVCRRERPNLLLRQAGFRKNGAQVSPEELAKIFTRYGAQVIFPFHHDFMLRTKSRQWVDDYFSQVSEQVSLADPGAVFVYPEDWKWYEIATTINAL